MAKSNTRHLRDLWCLSLVMGLVVCKCMFSQSQTPPIVQQPSPLLLLPAELRTKIWIDAMPDNITLSKEKPIPRLPRIGRTCRQTRCETMSVLALSTHFNFDIDQTDGAFTCESSYLLYKWKMYGRSSDRRKVNVSYTLTGEPRWRNLLLWAQGVHAGGSFGSGPTHIPVGNATLDVVASTLSIARQLQSRPWENAKKVLEMLPAARDIDWA